jgi:hypothetical protein
MEAVSSCIVGGVLCFPSELAVVSGASAHSYPAFDRKTVTLSYQMGSAKEPGTRTKTGLVEDIVLGFCLNLQMLYKLESVEFENESQRERKST